MKEKVTMKYKGFNIVNIYFDTWCNFLLINVIKKSKEIKEKVTMKINEGE